MKRVQFVGMDVHKDSISSAVLNRGKPDPELEIRIPNTKKSITRLFMKLKKHGRVIACYEAGSMGFELNRFLESMDIECRVIAPGRVEKKRGNRIKTDRRDALALARLLKNGEAIPIHVPAKEDEAVRDFLRARTDMKLDLTRTKQRLQKFLLRHGYIYSGTNYWTGAHDRWLKSLSFPFPMLKATFDTYYFRMKEQNEQIHLMDRQVEEIATREPYAADVARLRCLKGVDYLTALSFVCEIGDFKRFANAAHFMSFLGLIPSEHSSGTIRRQGSITKAGNAHLRKLLIESSWHYRYTSPPSKRLQERREGQPPEIIAYANRALKRLQKKFARLSFKGKKSQVAVTAVARELAGFIWGLMAGQTA
jgi:transposase